MPNRAVQPTPPGGMKVSGHNPSRSVSNDSLRNPRSGERGYVRNADFPKDLMNKSGRHPSHGRRQDDLAGGQSPWSHFSAASQSNQFRLRMRDLQEDAKGVH